MKYIVNPPCGSGIGSAIMGIIGAFILFKNK
jgi:hypothetical protein